MSKSPNKLWALRPILSILLIAVAYYLKVPAFRDAVNARFPWAKQHLSHFVPPPEIVIIRDAPSTPIPSAPAERPPSVPVPAKELRQASTPTPAPKAHDEPLTLKAIAANHALWPKTVKLRCAIEFPAVLDGKVIGKVQAPAGTEARLVMIKGQQAGVEFRGGGAWVAISATDLMEKIATASR